MARHEPLVMYAVKRQKLGDLPMEEAVQAGRMGLWEAIRDTIHKKATSFRRMPTQRLCTGFGQPSRTIVWEGREHASARVGNIFSTLGSGAGRSTPTGRDTGKFVGDGIAITGAIASGDRSLPWPGSELGCLFSR